MSQPLITRVRSAAKWSAVTEVVAKLVTPVTSMVLARLLAPEAFGVVTTLTMIISFAELFTDAGFQKYLVQHEFADDEDRDQSTCVAFWSNLALSIFFWLAIAIFSDPLADLVGSPGLGHVLIIACASIPLAAFSSIQSALYKRDFDFKTLFKVRVISVLTPLFVTLPLAFWLHSYWALIIGSLSQNAINAVMLTSFSKWKPHLYFSLTKLKEMFSFSVWSMAESISVWLTGYVDVFIIGRMLNAYYLGLYKTSITLVSAIMGLITSVSVPILFSALSRLQNDEKEFLRLFFRFQKVVGLLVLPLGFGIFLFSDLATGLILGSQWSDASGFVGLWGLTSSFTIILSHYCSEVFRAKGRPRLTVLAQVLHLAVLVPAILIAVRYDFETLYTVRSLVRFELIAVNIWIMGWIVKMPVSKMFTNILPATIASAAMFIIMLLPAASNIWQNVLYAFLASMVYLGVIMLFPSERRVIATFPRQILRR